MDDSKLIRILSVYSAVSAAAIVWLAFLALSPQDEVNAERVNIVDAAGNVRLALANPDRLPEAVVNGKKLGGKRDAAGMIFFNDEGTECGGLIFGGKTVSGKPQVGASLTFDQYNQDQTIALQYVEEKGQRFAGLQFNDLPEIGMDRTIGRIDAARRLPPEEQKVVFQKMSDEGLLSVQRLYVGKNRAKASQVVLSDGKGRPRLALRVAADGAAEIVFTDAAGNVVRTIKGG